METRQNNHNQAVYKTIYERYKHMFSDKAKNALFKRKATTAVIQYNHPTRVLKPHESYDPYPTGGLLNQYFMSEIATDKYSVNLYRTFCRLAIDMKWERRIATLKGFGVVVDNTSRIPEAAEYVANYINNIAELPNVIEGCMEALYVTTLYNDPINPTEEIGTAVYSYPAIYAPIDDPYLYKTANKTDIEFQEGGIPRSLDDLKS